MLAVYTGYIQLSNSTNIFSRIAYWICVPSTVSSSSTAAGFWRAIISMRSLYCGTTAHRGKAMLMVKKDSCMCRGSAYVIYPTAMLATDKIFF
jgi:hypothetical protein